MAATRPERIASALRLTVSAKPLWIDVSGGSMGRAIVPGSEVLVGPADVPRLGQIWAFCDDSGLIVVHRSRGRHRGLFMFEGDAAGRADAPVDAGRLIGRVLAVRSGDEMRRLGSLDAALGACVITLRRAIRGLRRRAGR